MLIAFEGPIAAGKTTLATLYSEYSGGALILEEFEKNEFLADFYADKPRWSLPMQLSFALDRNAQWGRFETAIQNFSLQITRRLKTASLPER
jgi:deoxyadenosine/deoxycytidine kinase